MPVIRKPIEVRDTRSIQPVQMPNNPMGQVLERQAERVIQTSVAMGRMLAGEAEDYSKDLVRQAQIEVNPETGAPQMPPNVTKEMGRIAQKTWDNGIADRMVHEIAVNMRGQIDIAKNNNPNDVQAFTEEATGYLTKLGNDLPPEFQGAFLSIMNKELQTAGANVGAAQGIRQQNEQISFVPVQMQTSLQRIRQFLSGGDPNGPAFARQEALASINFIMSKTDEIVPADQKMKLLNDVLFEAGAGRYMLDHGLKDLSPTELALHSYNLKFPNAETSEKLAEYFSTMSVFLREIGVDEGIVTQWHESFAGFGYNMGSSDMEAPKTYNSNLGELFSRRVDELISEKTGSYKQAEDMVALRADMVKYRNGEASKTNDLQIALNTQMGEWLGLGTYKEGPDAGKPIPLTRDHLLKAAGNGGLSHEQRNILVARIKQGGFPPKVVEEVLQGFENRLNDPESSEAVFFLYRDLKKAPNLNQKEVDFSDLFGSKSLAVLDMIDLLYGYNQDFGHTLAQAEQAVNRIRMDETSDQTYANFLNTAMTQEKGVKAFNEFFSLGNRLDKISPKDVKQLNTVVADFLIEKHGVGGINDPTAVSEASKADIAEYFKTQILLQDRNSTTNAKIVSEGIKFTKNRFLDALKPNEYMTKLGHDPLKKFGEVPKGGMWEALKSLGALSTGFVLQGFEDLLSFDTEAGKANAINLGAAWLQAKPFDLAIDKEIRRLLNENNFSALYEQTGNRLYEAGVHYGLELVEGTGDTPHYRILMINEFGQLVPISDEIYDPTEDVGAFQGLSTTDDWNALTAGQTETRLKAKYGPYVYSAMNIVSGGALDATRGRMNDLSKFTKPQQEYAVDWMKRMEKVYSKQGLWEGDKRTARLKHFKTDLKKSYSQLSDEQAERLFDAAARPEIPFADRGAVIKQLLSEENIRTAVTATGVLMLNAIDAGASGQEAVQRGTDIVYKDGVGNNDPKIKTNTNEAPSSDQSETQVSAKRANTVLDNGHTTIKVSDLWNKNNSMGKSIRDVMISDFSEKEQQNRITHIETLTLEMNKNGWKITVQEAKKMLETYKQENPDWFK